MHSSFFDGLAGLWHMNEEIGITIGDSSGSSNNGICYGVTNLATSGTASASPGTHSSYNVNGPKDGQGGTWGTCPPSGSCSVWVESFSSSLAWWQVDLGSIKTINQVKALTSTTGSNAYYKVQTSPDGSAWTDKGSTTAMGWVTFNFADTSARYVRIQETTNTGNNYLYIVEVEVYDSTPCNLTSGKLSSALYFDGTDLIM